MEILFDNGSMTMTFHILNVHEWLGGHATGSAVCVIQEPRTPLKPTELGRKTNSTNTRDKTMNPKRSQVIVLEK